MSSMNKKMVLGLLSISFVYSNICSAKELSDSWQTDCVGRMQIGLPEKADVAGMTVKSWLGFRQSHDPAGYFFADGQRASYSYFRYDGLLNVTSVVSSEDLQAIRTTVIGDIARGKDYISQQAKLNKNNNFVKDLSVKPQDGFGWHRSTLTGNELTTDERLHAYLFLDNQYVEWGMGSDPEHFPQLQQTYQTLINGLRTRKNFDVQTDTGVCLPYNFIRDDGSNNHSIGTTYRLPSHPDVTILLESAGGSNLEFTTEKQAIAKADFFWSQRYRRAYKKIKNLRFGSHNDIAFAEHRGIETMFSLVREDDSEDFSYMVVMYDDNAKTKDTTAIMMYVIRDAKNAKFKGIKPINKKDFFKLAKAIAASVKPRVEQGK